MVELIYTIVTLIGTAIGAFIGLGGGLIINPIMVFLKYHDLSTITFLSTCAVFTMTVYNTAVRLLSKEELDKAMVFLISSGAVFGGTIGAKLFDGTLLLLGEKLAIGIQSIIIIVIFIVVMIYSSGEYKSYKIKHRLGTFSIGLGLGALSSYLGIGGGPLNILVYCLFFGCALKTAMIYSLVTILFSTATRLLVIASTYGFAQYDTSLLWYILPAALLGGIIGGLIHKKASERTTRLIFLAVCLLLTVLNIINAKNALF